jgi:predicted permease
VTACFSTIKRAVLILENGSRSAVKKKEYEHMAGIILQQAIIMLILNVVGMIAYYTGIVSREGGKQLSNVVLEIVTPVIIVHAYLEEEYDSRLVVNLLLTFVLAAASYVIAILISMLCFREKSAGKLAPIERFSATYSNCGFMGIPLASALFGAEGVFYVTAFLTIFFLFSWTHGVMQLTQTKDFKKALKVLRSPTVIGIAIGLILYFVQLPMPGLLMDTMGYISDLNTPLAMIASGVSVAQANLLGALCTKRIYWVSFVKLLVIPLAVMAMCLCLPFVSMEVRTVVLLLTAAPAAAMCTLQCQVHGLNDIYASQIFAATTILSMATMPLLIQIFSMLT